METAFEALVRVGFKLKYSFGIESVNKVFKGGLNPGEIYEIVGESGVGKTQLMMSVAHEYLSSQPRFGVCWVDSNGSFKSRRFLEFDCEREIEILDRLFLSSVSDYRNLVQKLQIIENNFEQLGIRLLFIDNIGYIMNKTAWTLKTGGSDAQRTVISLLKGLVKKRMTIVISNHLVRAEGEVRPSLGRFWSKLESRQVHVCEDERGTFVKEFNRNEDNKGYFRVSGNGVSEIDSLSTDTFSG